MVTELGYGPCSIRKHHLQTKGHAVEGGDTLSSCVLLFKGMRALPALQNSNRGRCLNQPLEGDVGHCD